MEAAVQEKDAIATSCDGNVFWIVDPEEDQLKPYRYNDVGELAAIVWAPQAGSQEALFGATNHLEDLDFLEILVEGNRGGGKTDSMLMAFGQHIGRGYGADYTGILFRRTYPELEDVKRKCNKLIKQIWPDANFNQQNNTWTWSTGEQLLFRHAKSENDYDHYHGHNYAFVMFEELTTWADPGFYLMAQSICRSARKGMPLRMVSTTNPYGPGHTWVRKRFRLPLTPGRVIGPIIRDSIGRDGTIEKPRVAIHSHFDENLVLRHADPDYFSKLHPRNPAQLAAWKHGSWTVASGGILEDVWDNDVHNVPPFNIPHTWVIDRAFDWGSSKPFSVGWFAVSDGSSIQFANGRTMRTLKGDTFMVREWYGTNGQPNEGLGLLARDISEGIVEREAKWSWRQPGLKRSDCRVIDGPADNAIFDTENGVCIADDMETKVTWRGALYRGITWTLADKKPGSRKLGWEALRQALKNSLPYKEVEDPVTKERKKVSIPREFPGFFVVGLHCPYWIEHVPNLPRDKKDPDDVDTESEDHDGDMTRYRIRQMGFVTKPGKVIGGF